MAYAIFLNLLVYALTIKIIVQIKKANDAIAPIMLEAIPRALNESVLEAPLKYTIVYVKGKIIITKNAIVKANSILEIDFPQAPERYTTIKNKINTSKANVKHKGPEILAKFKPRPSKLSEQQYAKEIINSKNETTDAAKAGKVNVFNFFLIFSP